MGWMKIARRLVVELYTTLQKIAIGVLGGFGGLSLRGFGGVRGFGGFGGLGLRGFGGFGG